MNYNKQDAIKMAIHLKKQGYQIYQVVKELDKLGYRNPQTQKAWSKSLVTKHTTYIKPLVDLNAIPDANAKEFAINARKSGMAHVQILEALEKEGHINLRTNKPYSLFYVNKWAGRIETDYKRRAKARACELYDDNLTPRQVQRELAAEGLINERTGKPYSVNAVEHWLGVRW